MKVSLNWAQHISGKVDLRSVPLEELLNKIGAQLGAVEEVIAWGPRYDGIFVVKVESCEPHPNADKLHVCRINDGGAVKDVERGEDGFVQVVCGAPNVHSGMLAVWLPPGITVPSTLEKDPFTLGAREIRGIMSNGMMGSAAELGISDDHSGILEVKSRDVGDELARPGTPFKQLYGLDDVIIDCENKMFTHRPDCFGILGVARELAGITNQKFVSPEWYKATPVFEEASDVALKVSVETELVPRFMAVAMSSVTVADSPIYMQAGLSRVGIRPINNVVDITNWMMHLTAQPQHAYDLDKVKALCSGTPHLIARLSKKGEKISLLNGKEIELDDETIVIATDQKVIGIAGVMGGAETEVDEHTKNIILETASFDMYSIRRTAMKYGLFTDAVTRYNKGQSPLQNDRVMAETMRLLNEISGAVQASKVMDVHSEQALSPMPAILVPTQFINERLGSSLQQEEINRLLSNVECVGDDGTFQTSRSYIMGVGSIDDKLTRIGVVINEKTPDGHYKVTIPVDSEMEYEKLVGVELKPGFWNEYIGAHNVFLFKDLDGKVTRYEVAEDTEHEIIETCRAYTNEFYSSIENMLNMNSWYRPLLPLKKTTVSSVDELEATKENIVVVPPFWRRDLELPEDIVEEVGRLYGFNKLPVVLPMRAISPTAKNGRLEFLQTVRSILARSGANELLTYSFVHERLLKCSGQKTEDAFHLRNALSPELQYYRLSLTPSILEKVHTNIKSGYDRFVLFEIGKGHNKTEAPDEDGVPAEEPLLALVAANKAAVAAEKHGAAFFAARKYLEHMAEQLNVALDYEPLGHSLDWAAAGPFEPSRSALIRCTSTGEMLGIMGEYTSAVRTALKLPMFAAGFEINTRTLAEAAANKTYQPIARFPKTTQDITFRVTAATTYASIKKQVALATAAASEEHGYIISWVLADIFRGEEGTLSYTFSFTMHHPDRTLVTAEATAATDSITSYVNSAVGSVGKSSE